MKTYLPVSTYSPTSTGVVDINAIFMIANGHLVAYNQLMALLQQGQSALAQSSNWQGLGGASFRSALSNWITNSQSQIDHLQTIHLALVQYGNQVQHCSDLVVPIAKTLGVGWIPGIWDIYAIGQMQSMAASLHPQLLVQLSDALSQFDAAEQKLLTRLGQIMVNAQKSPAYKIGIGQGYLGIGVGVYDKVLPSVAAYKSGFRIVRNGKYVNIKGKRYFPPKDNTTSITDPAVAADSTGAISDTSSSAKSLTWMQKLTMKGRGEFAGTRYLANGSEMTQLTKVGASVKESVGSLSKTGLGRVGLGLAVVPDIVNYSPWGTHSKVGYASNRFVISTGVDVGSTVATTAISGAVAPVASAGAGALSAAITGAEVGSVVPVVGTVAGFVVGVGINYVFSNIDFGKHTLRQDLISGATSVARSIEHTVGSWF